jgi:hypothetical protein
MMNQNTVDEQQLMSYVRHQASKPVADIAILIERGSDYVDGLLGDVSEPQACICPEPGEWCICEVLIHLVAATNGMTGLVKSLSAGVKPDIKLSAPTVRMETETLSELRQSLREAFENLRSVVQAMPEEAGAVTLLHPLHGELTAKEWAVMGYMHALDHGGQIEKVKQAPAYPS